MKMCCFAQPCAASTQKRLTQPTNYRKFEFEHTRDYFSKKYSDSAFRDDKVVTKKLIIIGV